MRKNDTEMKHPQIITYKEVKKKQLVRHVIDSSGWRHTRRVTFPGGARHAATNQHIAPSAPPLDLCQLLKFLLLLTLLLRSCPRPPMILPWKSDFRQTMAVGGVQASVARG